MILFFIAFSAAVKFINLRHLQQFPSIVGIAVKKPKKADKSKYPCFCPYIQKHVVRMEDSNSRFLN